MSDSPSAKRHVSVVQIGARHHYAIPRMLEEAGWLHSFHTDSNAVQGLGKWLGKLPGGGGARLRKLSQRIPRGVPAAKVRTTDALLWRRIRAALKLGPEPVGYVEDDHLFDRIMAERGFAGADMLYAMQKHGTRMLDRAREGGLRVVIDVFITPVAHRIVEEERNRFPDLERPLDDPAMLDLEDERNREEFKRADLLLCPGHNVVEGLRAYPEAHGKAWAVVPYGSGVSFDGKRNEPRKGRILFAGTADLRKGIHYLGMAAKELAARGWEFRVAGNVSDQVRLHPTMSGLNFLGRVPRAEMVEEFLQADVFVLPTLAEGCASVVHEAVTAGCPVITTAASGTLVGNGRGGLLIPERNAPSLAEAIASVIENRNLRDELAASCELLVPELRESAWRERLLRALASNGHPLLDANP